MSKSLKLPDVFLPKEEQVVAEHDAILAIQAGDVGRLRNIIESIERSGQSMIEITNNAGNSLIHVASTIDRVVPATNAGRLDCLRLLLEKQMNPNSKDEEEQTPLHWAARYGNAAALKLLVEHGGDPLLQDRRGYNCLHHAAMDGNDMVCYWLIEQQNVPVDGVDHTGHTALHWAVYENREQLARLLLTLNADINKQDDNGFTPMHWAAVLGNRVLCRSLISCGANIDIRDNNGETPQDLANKRGFVALRDTIAEYHALNRYNRNQRVQRILWFMMGWFAIWSSVWLFVTQPLWMAVILSILELYVGMYLFSDRWPGLDFLNTYFMSVFAMGWWAGTFIFFSTIYPAMPENYFEHNIFITLNFTGTFLYLYLANSDPGAVPKNDKSKSLKALIPQIERNEELPLYCPTCMIIRPLRSKHCRICDCCVARMDHHCPWLGRCVGYRSHRLFSLLVLNLTANGIFFFIFCWEYLISRENTPDSLWPFWRTFPQFYALEPLVFVGFLINAFALGGNLQLIWEQFRSISSNLTQNEILTGLKYDYLLNKHGELDNPFDLGYYNNLKEWLFHSVDYYKLYFLRQLNQFRYGDWASAKQV